DGSYQEGSKRAIADAVAAPPGALERRCRGAVGRVGGDAGGEREHVVDGAGNEAIGRILKAVDVLEDGGEVQKIRGFELCELGVRLEDEQRIVRVLLVQR